MISQNPEPTNSYRINDYLPNYNYSERHHIDIEADQTSTYKAARNLDFSTSKTIRRLFIIRRLHADTLSIDEMTSGSSFKILDEHPPTEFVIGLAGTASRPFAFQSGTEFKALAPKSGVKVAWNFRTEPLTPTKTRLHTETRTATYGKAAKATFAGYWIIIRPFSGWIRKEMLKAASTSTEQRIRTPESVTRPATTP